MKNDQKDQKFLMDCPDGRVVFAVPVKMIVSDEYGKHRMNKKLEPGEICDDSECQYCLLYKSVIDFLK